MPRNACAMQAMPCFAIVWSLDWKKEKIENYETSSSALLARYSLSTFLPSWATFDVYTRSQVTGGYAIFMGILLFIITRNSDILEKICLSRWICLFVIWVADNSRASLCLSRFIIFDGKSSILSTNNNHLDYHTELVIQCAEDDFNSMTNTVKATYFLLVLSGFAGPALASSHHKNKGGKKESYKYDVVFEEVADNDFIENNLQDLGDRIIWGQEILFDKIGGEHIGLTTVIHNHYHVSVFQRST